ncbi:MAG TPA: hypothetical protein V6C84_26780 [Coleofasciculaceae cyanobacterium]
MPTQRDRQNLFNSFQDTSIERFGNHPIAPPHPIALQIKKA